MARELSIPVKVLAQPDRGSTEAGLAATSPPVIAGAIPAGAVVPEHFVGYVAAAGAGYVATAVGSTPSVVAEAASGVSPAEVRDFHQAIAHAGGDAWVEGGICRGFVRGLEVARLEPGNGSGPATMAVGVGRNDAQGHGLLHSREVPEALVERVVGLVAARRRAGQPAHPANQLALERWLRDTLVRHPDLGRCSWIAPVFVPGDRFFDRQPVAAAGIGTDGRAAVVVCSVGVDVTLVPYAARARRWLRSALPLGGIDDARLLLVVPAPDAIAPLRRMAGLLRGAELVTVLGTWRAVAGARRGEPAISRGHA